MRSESIPALIVAILAAVLFIVLVPITHAPPGLVLLPIIAGLWMAIVLGASLQTRTRIPRGP